MSSMDLPGLKFYKTYGLSLNYTVFQKNYTLFIFAITFFIREPIFIIFDNNMREKICNKTYIVFTTSPNLCAPTLPCNTSGKSD